MQIPLPEEVEWNLQWNSKLCNYSWHILLEVISYREASSEFCCGFGFGDFLGVFLVVCCCGSGGDFFL